MVSASGVAWASPASMVLCAVTIIRAAATKVRFMGRNSRFAEHGGSSPRNGIFGYPLGGSRGYPRRWVRAGEALA
ncbi:hypothetical protein GCM10023222_05710 [Saccharopolyspora cebuensis]